MGIMLALSGVFVACVIAAIFYAENKSANVEPVDTERDPLALPKVVLSYGENKLVLHNLGNDDLYLWGDKFGAHDRDMLREGCLVPATGQSDLPVDHLKTWALDAIGHDGQQLVPLAMYFADESGVHKFSGNFLLLIRIKKGVVTIDTRTLGVTSQPW